MLFEGANSKTKYWNYNEKKYRKKDGAALGIMARGDPKKRRTECSIKQVQRACTLLISIVTMARSTGNTIHGFHGMDPVLRILSASKPPRDAVHAPLVMDTATVSTGVTANVVPGASGASLVNTMDAMRAAELLSKQLDHYRHGNFPIPACSFTIAGYVGTIGVLRFPGRRSPVGEDTQCARSPRLA